MSKHQLPPQIFSEAENETDPESLRMSVDDDALYGAIPKTPPSTKQRIEPPLTGNRVYPYGFVIAVSLVSVFLPLVILTPMANDAQAWRSFNGPRFLGLDGMNIGVTVVPWATSCWLTVTDAMTCLCNIVRWTSIPHRYSVLSFAASFSLSCFAIIFFLNIGKPGIGCVTTLTVTILALAKSAGTRRLIAGPEA